MRVPDLIEPLVGWRGWRVRDGRLWGVHYPAAWPSGEPIAAYCGSLKDHDAPGEGCNCGVHAAKDEEGLRLNYLFGLPDVYGKVNLWGRVAVHSRGYRAEFGYPRELFVRGERWLDALREYDVPVSVL